MLIGDHVPGVYSYSAYPLHKVDESGYISQIQTRNAEMYRHLSKTPQIGTACKSKYSPEENPKKTLINC